MYVYASSGGLGVFFFYLRTFFIATSRGQQQLDFCSFWSCWSEVTAQA